MGVTNELMEFLSASLGATLDEIYQRLIDCDFTREDSGLAIFVVALLNALGREGRGNRHTEVVLMLAYGESGTAERGRNRLMRWRPGEMSGHDLAREPGLGEQRDHRLGEMPLPVQPAQPLIGAKRQRDGPGPSHSVDSPTAAPPLKKVRVSEIEIQTSETIETLEKKEKDQSELCAKLQEYRAIARDRENRKSSHEPESGEVESQRSGDLFNERRSVRRERARRWCDTSRGRKREPDTPYALGRSDSNRHKIEEDGANPGRH